MKRIAPCSRQDRHVITAQASYSKSAYGLSSSVKISSLAAVDFFAETGVRSFAMAVMSALLHDASARTALAASGVGVINRRGGSDDRVGTVATPSKTFAGGANFTGSASGSDAE